MKGPVFLALLVVHTTALADRAEGIFSIGYMLNYKFYIDYVSAYRDYSADRAYAGTSSDGSKVWGVRAGAQMCESYFSIAYGGETWCWPWKAKSGDAIYTFTVCSTLTTCYTASVTAHMERLTTKTAKERDAAPDRTPDERYADKLAHLKSIGIDVK